MQVITTAFSFFLFVCVILVFLLGVIRLQVFQDRGHIFWVGTAGPNIDQDQEALL